MLRTVEEVVDALGGPSAAADIIGVSLPAVSNWKARGRLPTDKFFIFERELSNRQMSADRSLFGFEAEARP